MENLDLNEQFRNSFSLRELSDRLLRCAGYLTRQALERQENSKATVSFSELWRYNIDPNHDYTAMETLTGLLQERPEVEQLQEDGSYSFVLNPEACRIHQALSGLIRQGLSESENGGWYLESGRLLEFANVDIRAAPERELFFAILDERPEVKNWFYNENLSGIGLDFNPKLCSGQESEQASGMEMLL